MRLWVVLIPFVRPLDKQNVNPHESAFKKA